MGDTVLHGFQQNLPPLLHAEVRNQGLGDVAGVGSKDAVRIAVFPDQKVSVRKLGRIAVDAQHLDDLCIGRDDVSADSLQDDGNLCADLVQVVAVRQAVRIHKEVLIPADGVKTVLHLFRILLYEVPASSDHLVDGWNAVDVHLVQSLSKLHEVQMGVVEPRNQGLSAAVDQLCISVCQGQNILVAADGGNQPALN